MQIGIRSRLVIRKSCTALLLAVASLIVGLCLNPVHADTEYRAIYWFYMVDAKTGWALTHGENGDSLLRTTDGAIHWKDVTPLDSSKRKILIASTC